MKEAEQQYIVCTQCMTFNHASFISDTLSGFKMQETSFPVVFCIIDDASTDGEQDLLRQWAFIHLNIDSLKKEDTCDYEKIEAPLKDKENLQFVIILLKDNHFKKRSKLPYISAWIENSKYLAYCEGDDYWIDSYKLQKQVDYLDNHPDYGMVTSAAKIYEQGVGMRRGKYGHAYKGIQDLLKGNYIYYASILKRKSLNDRYNSEIGIQPTWMMGDWPVIIHCAIVSKIGYLEEPMTVYRIQSNSVSHFDDFNKFKAFNENSVHVAYFFIDKYNLDAQRLKPQLENWLNWRLLMKACSLGDAELVCQYKHKVRGLSAKERFQVALLSNRISNALYKFYKNVRSSARLMFKR